MESLSRHELKLLYNLLLLLSFIKSICAFISFLFCNRRCYSSWDCSMTLYGVSRLFLLRSPTGLTSVVALLHGFYLRTACISFVGEHYYWWWPPSLIVCICIVLDSSFWSSMASYGSSICYSSGISLVLHPMPSPVATIWLKQGSRLPPTSSKEWPTKLEYPFRGYC